MHGVAEYMYKHAKEYGLSPWRMYLLGYLHEIGEVAHDTHPTRTGAQILMEEDSSLCLIIYWHKSPPSEYKAIHGCTNEEIPKELVLLWEADNRVGKTGKEIGFTRKMREVEETYGKTSHEAVVCREIIQWMGRRQQ